MNKKTKIVPINELPSASSVEDDDILIKSNFENTEKMTANQLQEYVNKRRKHADWEETDIKSDAYIENKPTSLSADGGNADTVNGHTVESDVPQNAKFTDTVYIHPNSGVTASTYKSVTVDSKGHVTSGTNPSTLNEYGITDAVSKTELENKVNIHNSSDTSHSDIREFIKDLNRRLNALADSDDTTLDQMSEIVTYIKSNKSLIDDITTTKVNVTDIIDNLASVSTNKPLSAKQGKLLNDLINSLKSSVETKVENISGDSVIGVVKTENNYSVTHKDITRNNTTSSVSPKHGNSFIAVKSILTDNKGHITNVETETVTLPNESIEGVVSGVKGVKETLYRNGNVNLTPQDIGALPEDGNAVSATKAIQDGSGRSIVGTYLQKSGDSMNGALNFANVMNRLGDNALIGDMDHSGGVCIRGTNGDTRLMLIGREDAGQYSQIKYISGKDLQIKNANVINLQSDYGLQVRNENNTAWQHISASAFNQVSSKRYKKNINGMEEDVARQILEYRPVIYDYINESDGTECMGLIAEEVDQINKYPVTYKDGVPDALDYSKFVPQIIKMLQIQETKIQTLEKDLETIKNSVY